MFFGRKKQREEEVEKLRHLEDGINKINEDLHGFREELLGELRGTLLGELREELKAGRREEEKWLRRQSESFEDLLEELQEDRERQNASKRLLEEAELREQALLAMVCCGREQMQLLERQITNDGTLSGEKQEAWVKQFEVMKREAQKFMRSCGIEETGTIGEPLDYDIHEVLELTDTAEEGKAGTIAEVFSYGSIYRGRLMKKAQVAAYRMISEKTTSEHTSPDGEIQEGDR